MSGRARKVNEDSSARDSKTQRTNFMTPGRPLQQDPRRDSRLPSSVSSRPQAAQRRGKPIHGICLQQKIKTTKRGGEPPRLQPLEAAKRIRAKGEELQQEPIGKRPMTGVILEELSRTPVTHKSKKQVRRGQQVTETKLPADLNLTNLLKQEMLVSDKGRPFPKQLLNRFKQFKGACALIKAGNKEQHRIAHYLIKHRGLDASVLVPHDKAGTLSHFLLLKLAEWEDSLRRQNKCLPPFEDLTPSTPQLTVAESVTAFAQDHHHRIKRKRLTQATMPGPGSLSPSTQLDYRPGSQVLNPPKRRKAEPQLVRSPTVERQNTRVAMYNQSTVRNLQARTPIHLCQESTYPITTPKQADRQQMIPPDVVQAESAREFESTAEPSDLRYRYVPQPTTAREMIPRGEITHVSAVIPRRDNTRQETIYTATSEPRRATYEAHERFLHNQSYISEVPTPIAQQQPGERWNPMYTGPTSRALYRSIGGQGMQGDQNWYAQDRMAHVHQMPQQRVLRTDRNFEPPATRQTMTGSRGEPIRTRVTDRQPIRNNWLQAAPSRQEFIPVRRIQRQTPPTANPSPIQMQGTTLVPGYPVQSQRLPLENPQQSFSNRNEERFRTLSDDYRRRADLAIAASYYQGEERERLLTDAAVGGRNKRESAKEREVENLRKWARNPSSTSLREIGPNSILKSIFSIKNLSNPPAEVFYSMLAF